MKKLLLFLLIPVFLYSCKKDDVPAIRPIDATVTVAYDEGAKDYGLPLQDVEVKITNSVTGTVVTQKSSQDGLVSFEKIPVGVYDVDATITIDAATYSEATGTVTESDIVFNGTLKNQSISENQASFEIELAAGKIGDFVIKQVYYAGSDRTDGALYRDQFIEIYNNSNEVLYADGLYVMQAFGSNKVDPDFSRGYYQNNRQLDWTKSMNIPAESKDKANTDYLYTRSLLRIPGDGQTYPVQPGESVVLAQSALNHKQPFQGNNGESISVRNPALTVDLSGADFEAHYGPLVTRPLATDVDNPNVPNLDVIRFYGTDWLLDNPGRDAFVIFKTDQDIATFPSVASPESTTITSTTNLYLQIPKSLIIDGVESAEALPAERVAKKLPIDIDAGFSFVPKSSYSSQSIIRKTLKTVGGRKILMDTNNSANDFTFFDVAQPRGFKD